MNRREFARIFRHCLPVCWLHPFAVTAANHPPPDNSGRPPRQITRLRIGNWRTTELRERNRLARASGRTPDRPDPPDDEYNYWAEAIEDGDRFHYRVDGPPACLCMRIRVLLPNKLSTRSTASSAVMFRRSRAGLSSTMSSEPSRPVSAIISMHSCASR